MTEYLNVTNSHHFDQLWVLTDTLNYDKQYKKKSSWSKLTVVKFLSINIVILEAFRKDVTGPCRAAIDVILLNETDYPL